MPYLNTLVNVDGLTFPVQTRDIPHFERTNPQISVKVLAIDNYDTQKRKYSYSIDYASPHRNCSHHVNLLLLEDENDSSKKHCTWIRNMSALVADRSNSDARSYVCYFCLHCFTTQQAYDRHVSYCIIHPAQHVKYPTTHD